MTIRTTIKHIGSRDYVTATVSIERRDAGPFGYRSHGPLHKVERDAIAFSGDVPGAYWIRIWSAGAL